MAVYPVTFVTPEREVQTEAADDQYLLDVAAAAGLDLPYSCLQGWCTTCAGKVLAGEVDQSGSAAGLSAGQGGRLRICCTTPSPARPCAS